MSKEVHFTDSEFEQMVGSGVALVDFWAPWCGPCRMQGPVVEKLAEQFHGQAVIGKMNVEEHKVVAGRFGVRAIPTLVLLKNGQEVQRFQGIQSEDTLAKALNRHIGEN
jgi:thioredoxin 1